MSIIPNQNKTIQENNQSNWLDNTAMSILFKKLDLISTGLLQVHVNGMLYEFGNTENKCDIHAVIHIHNNRAFRTILVGGEPAAGKAYIDGWWTSYDLIEVLRLFATNRNTLFGFDNGIASLGKTIDRLANNILRNTLKGSKRNIKAHYDIGNDLYELFLDENGQKISKSKGNGVSLEEWLAYAPSESLAYYMYQSPQKAKKLYFDGIPKYVDEYITYLKKYETQTEEEKK